MNTWKTDRYCCVGHPGYGTSWVKIVLSQNGHTSSLSHGQCWFPLSHCHTLTRPLLCSSAPAVPSLCSRSQLCACSSLSQSPISTEPVGRLTEQTQPHGSSSVCQRHLSLFHFIQHGHLCETKLAVPEVPLNSGTQ